MNFTKGIKAGFLFVIVAGLAACGPSSPPQTQYVQQPAPQVQQYQQPQYQQYPQQPVVVQQHDTGIGTGTALLGAAAVGATGYMAGKAMSDKDKQTNNTVVYRDRPAYVQPSTSTPPPVTAPVAKPATPVAAQAPAKAFVPQSAANTATVKPMRAPTPSVSTSSFKPAAVAKRK